MQGRYVGAAGWGFLAIIGVILMWAGFTGRVGTLIGAIFTPRDLIVAQGG